MAIQPLVVATIKEKSEQRIAPTAKDCVVLKNIGRGPALYIQVNEIEFEKFGSGRFVATFEGIDYLEAGKETVAEVKWQGEFDSEGASRPIDFVSNLKPQSARQSYDVFMSYEDISGQKRQSVVRMGKGGIKLLRHGKAT